MSMNEKLIEHLSAFVSENRQQRMDDVLSKRTRFLSVVLEDIFQPHNSSAVLRSCECFGVQDIHIIEKANRYRVNPDIALGSAQWLTLNRYKNSAECLQNLKDKGYQIAAWTFETDGFSIDELNLFQPTALCFGTEETGLSKEAIKMADVKVKVPMAGFTQSFNISVCAAISLYALTQELLHSDTKWALSPEEKEALKIDWLVNSIPGGNIIKEEFMNKA